MAQSEYGAALGSTICGVRSGLTPALTGAFILSLQILFSTSQSIRRSPKCILRPEAVFRDKCIRRDKCIPLIRAGFVDDRWSKRRLNDFSWDGSSALYLRSRRQRRGCHKS